MHRELAALLTAAGSKNIIFQEVMEIIRRHYETVPTAFRTGDGSPAPVDNPAGTNSASCQLLAFARRLQLDEATTLGLYAEHYASVLADPEGNSHANIRAFMACGWSGVRFSGDCLRLRGPG